MAWLRGLPVHFQEELEGVSQGSGVSLQRLAEWGFVENCHKHACSGLATVVDGNVWVARNHDAWLPDLWGYAVIRNIDGRIPTMIFGMEGDVFTATGINAEQLWLHYQSLDGQDSFIASNSGMNCYVWIREALETCATIEQVETVLRTVDRSDGMILFAVDGKDESFCLFECGRTDHVRIAPEYGWVSATNHSLRQGDLQEAAAGNNASVGRLGRINELRETFGSWKAPDDLIRVLADEEVAVGNAGDEFGTVYSNVACPSKKLVWFAYGDLPAPRVGTWREVDWPW